MTTHRKTIARRLAERTGQTYQQSLAAVRDAADRGLLPSRLDAAGTDRAVESLAARVLSAPPTVADVADDRGAEDQGAGVHESLYLIPSSLALLRQVWQGRVTKEAVAARTGTTSRFYVDNLRAAEGVDTDLFLLEREGYLEARLLVGEEWVVARTTDLGDRALAENGADQDIHDGIDRSVLRSSQRRRVRALENTRAELEIDSKREPIDEEIVDVTNARMRATYHDAARMGLVSSVRDLEAVAAELDPAGRSAVDGGLDAVAVEQFGHEEGSRRRAASPADQQIWDFSWVWERLTGKQCLLYISSPGGGADRYVFSGTYTAFGRREAREHVEGLIAALRKRDDLTWPPKHRE